MVAQYGESDCNSGLKSAAMRFLRENCLAPYGPEVLPEQARKLLGIPASALKDKDNEDSTSKSSSGGILGGLFGSGNKDEKKDHTKDATPTTKGEALSTRE